ILLSSRGDRQRLCNVPGRWCEQSRSQRAWWLAPPMFPANPGVTRCTSAADREAALCRAQVAAARVRAFYAVGGGAAVVKSSDARPKSRRAGTTCGAGVHSKEFGDSRLRG